MRNENGKILISAKRKMDSDLENARLICIISTQLMF